MLSILAFTFSTAETVMASLCALSPSLLDDAVVADGAAADDCMMSSPEGQGEDRGQNGGSQCPFGSGAAARGCFGAASLPAPSARLGTVWLDATITGSNVVRWNDLLLEAVLFHPPKA
jgi:hypothetical protein